jgi:hypothetical protein
MEERRALAEIEALHADWLAAHQAASEAEASVRAAAEAFEQGAPQGATLEQFEAAVRLRAVANGLLERILEVTRRNPI